MLSLSPQPSTYWARGVHTSYIPTYLAIKDPASGNLSIVLSSHRNGECLVERGGGGASSC